MLPPPSGYFDTRLCWLYFLARRRGLRSATFSVAALRGSRGPAQSAASSQREPSSVLPGAMDLDSFGANAEGVELPEHAYMFESGGRPPMLTRPSGPPPLGSQAPALRAR